MTRLRHCLSHSATPCHPAAPQAPRSCSFIPSAAHSGPSSQAWTSSSSSPSTCHTPFLMLICHILFKGSGLSFWIPGFLYSSRNMYLYVFLLPLMDLLWRISVGLPSKILNEAKLPLLHFLKSKHRTALQQLTLHSVHYRASTSAGDSPKKSRSPLPRNISGQAVSGGRGTTPQSSEHTERGPTQSNLSIHC